ncbi:MAG TPA: hypothetical protein VJ813_09715 [Vicinamibacterales bacterium]|nr:hypothetical protein [Vicinamibacterales bacterium]
MCSKRLVACIVAAAVAGIPAAAVHARQGTIIVTGTARKEAKRPYTDNSVRARSVADGTVAMSVPLDATAGFTLYELQPGNYLLELVNREGKVVCTEGPLTFTKATKDVSINCGRDRRPLLLLLGAAAAAGITAGIVANDPASPSR